MNTSTERIFNILFERNRTLSVAEWLELLEVRRSDIAHVGRDYGLPQLDSALRKYHSDEEFSQPFLLAKDSPQPNMAKGEEGLGLYTPGIYHWNGILFGSQPTTITWKMEQMDWGTSHRTGRTGHAYVWGVTRYGKWILAEFQTAEEIRHDHGGDVKSFFLVTAGEVSISDPVTISAKTHTKLSEMWQSIYESYREVFNGIKRRYNLALNILDSQEAQNELVQLATHPA